MTMAFKKLFLITNSKIYYQVINYLYYLHQQNILAMFYIKIKIVNIFFENKKKIHGFSFESLRKKREIKLRNEFCNILFL